jgi:hypothetical protein
MNMNRCKSCGHCCKTRGKNYQRGGNLFIVDMWLLEDLLHCVEHGCHVFHLLGLKISSSLWKLLLLMCKVF